MATPDVKPRNFSAMREDRVVAMAAARFGRSFGSKREAVDALSTLPAAEQRGLKKPSSVGQARRMTASAGQPAAQKWSPDWDKVYGGNAVPSSDKLAQYAREKPGVVARYTRAQTTISGKSGAQSLTVLAKFGSTEVRKAAGAALEKSGLRAPRPSEAKAVLRAEYKSAFGVAAKSKATSKELIKALASAPAAKTVAPSLTARFLSAVAKGRAGAVATVAVATAAVTVAVLAKIDSAQAKESDMAETPGGTRLKVHKGPLPAPPKAAAAPATSSRTKSSGDKRGAKGMTSQSQSQERRGAGSVRVAPERSAPGSTPAPVAPATDVVAATSSVVTSGDPARDALLEQIRTATQSLANEQRSGFGQKSKDAASYLDRLNQQLADHDKGVAAAKDAAYARDRERAASESVKLMAEVAVGTTAGVLVARSVGKGEIARATAKAGEIKTLASEARAAMKAGGNQSNALSAIVNQANNVAGVKPALVAGKTPRPMPSKLGASKNWKPSANFSTAVAMATDVAIGRFVIPAITDDEAVQEAARISANTATAATVAFVQTREIQNAAAGKVGPAAKDLATLEAAHNQITTGKADKPAKKGPSVKQAVAEERARVAAESRSKAAAKGVATRQAKAVEAAHKAGVTAGKRQATVAAEAVGKGPAGWSDAARAASAESRAATAAATVSATESKEMLAKTLAKGSAPARAGATAMAGAGDDIAARLKGIKGQALKDVAKELGVPTSGKSAAALRTAILQGAVRAQHSGAKGYVAERVNVWGGTSPERTAQGLKDAATAKLREAEAKIGAAIDKVTTASPAKVTKASAAAAESVASTAGKTGLKSALKKAVSAGGKSAAVIAGVAVGAKVVGTLLSTPVMAATGAALAAKDSIDQGDEASVTAAKSTLGAVDMVAMGTLSMADQRLKDTGHGGAAGLLEDLYHAGLQKIGVEDAPPAPAAKQSQADMTGGRLLEGAAGAAAAGVGAGMIKEAIANESVHAFETLSKTGRVGRALAGGALVVGGAAAALDAITSSAEAGTMPAGDGKIGFQNEGTLNAALAAQGKAKAGEGEVPEQQAGLDAVNNVLVRGGAGALLAGVGVEMLKKPGLGPKVAGGALVVAGGLTAASAVTSTAERVVGSAPSGPLVPGAGPGAGRAYLNDAAAAKASEAPKAAPAVGPGRSAAAPAQRADGETAGYTTQRRTKTGLVVPVQVKAYRTPKR